MSNDTIFEQQNKLIIAEFSAKPLTLDYFLRWGSLGLYRFLEETYSTDDSLLWLFFTFQVLITLFTLGYALLRDFRYRTYVEKKIFSSDDVNSQLDYFLKGFSLEKPYELMSSSLSVIMRVFYTLTFAYMVVSTVYDIQELDFSIDTPYTRGLGMLSAVTFFIYGLFVMFISVLSVVNPPKQKITQLSDNQTIEEEHLPVSEGISLTKDNHSTAPEDYEEVD